MTLKEAFDMIDRRETPEQYEKRIKRLRKLNNERYDLEDKIEVLGAQDPRSEKAKNRLARVLDEIKKLS